MEAYTDFAEVYDTFMGDVPYEEWADFLASLIEAYGVSRPVREPGEVQELEEAPESGYIQGFEEAPESGEVQEFEEVQEEPGVTEEDALISERNLVLDLGCGTGTITELLYEKGYDMIGVDSSEEMLQIALDKKFETGSDILYLCQDMRELDLYSTVGTVVSVCDSLNYLLMDEDVLQTFHLVNNYLFPGGIFIFDFNTIYKYEEVIGDVTIAENREDCSFIWENFYSCEDHINEYDVTVLEESDSIGGISRTVNLDGNRMDIGGHRFFSKEQRVNEWWQSILPLQGAPSKDDKLLKREAHLVKGGADPEKTDKVMLYRRRVSRIYYLNKFFDYPVTMKMGTLINLGFLRTLEAGFSYLFAMMFKKPETSLENFYINRFGKKLYSMFFEDYTEKLWGRHPRDISADWGSQRVKGLSIKEVLSSVLHKGKSDETSLIEEFKYPKLGPGELWEAAAGEFTERGGKILKNVSVKRINASGNRVLSVIADTENGEKEFTGDIFFSSMPVKDLVGGISGIEIPETVKSAAANLPYRDFVTVGLLVDRMLLKNKTDIKTINDIVPDCWIYVQDKNVKLGRIQIFNNWSPYMVKEPENTVSLGLEYFCDEGDDFWNMPEEECIALASDELVRIGVIDCGAVLSAHRERVKKAYPAYFDSYKDLPEIIDFLNTLDNLYCVGRNGQHRYNNMDHSMMTSLLAVDNILSGKNDKSAIWNVNTEEEYHEKGDRNE